MLNQLANVDALINVARVFSDESVPHPDGRLDVERDIMAMNLELAFSDLDILVKPVAERSKARVELSLSIATSETEEIPNDTVRGNRIANKAI